MSTARKYWQSTGPTLPGMEISEPSIQAPLHVLTSSLGDSHVNPIRLQDSEKPQQMSGISGPNLRGLFASFGPNGCWSKTSWDYLAARVVTSSVAFSGTWPRVGMMLSGLCYRLPSSAHPIYGKEPLLWRTPQAQDHKSGRVQKGYQRNLVHQVLYPTPTASNNGYNKSKSPNARIRPSIGMMAHQKLLSQDQGHL